MGAANWLASWFLVRLNCQGCGYTSFCCMTSWFWLMIKLFFIHNFNKNLGKCKAKRIYLFIYLFIINILQLKLIKAYKCLHVDWPLLSTIIMMGVGFWACNCIPVLQRVQALYQQFCKVRVWFITLPFF